eukprot:4977365-Alexandrium_andersonii.AAC.1
MNVDSKNTYDDVGTRNTIKHDSTPECRRTLRQQDKATKSRRKPEKARYGKRKEEKAGESRMKQENEEDNR